MLGRTGGRCGEGDNGVNPAIDQFLRQPAELVRIAICEFPFKRDVLVLLCNQARVGPA